jgi:hypothetical protein
MVGANLKKIYVLLLSTPFSMNALKIDRVIVATDANPTYIHFWPLVAQAWKTKLGIKPTLVLVADQNTIVDETVGDVIRFTPLPNVPASFQAQTIRVLLPALFENDVCLTSDIDMLPLSSDYFNKAIEHVPSNCFVTYMNKAYPDGYPAFPICYNAARGKTFKEIFNMPPSCNHETISLIIKQWHAAGLGWQTDERMLYDHLMKWKDAHTRFIPLNDNTGPRRVDRSNWKYDKKLLDTNYYIDAHCLRPYPQHKKQIDQLLRDAQIPL